MSRAFCVKTAKKSLLIALVLSLTLVYFLIAQLSQDKSWGNKVSRVLQILNEKSIEGDIGNINIDEQSVVDREEEGEEKREDVRSDNTESEDWVEVEDPKQKIMDAKVMKKGHQKLIIVDIPNPKERWVKPEHD